jgi:hypothetical protein
MLPVNPWKPNVYGDIAGQGPKDSAVDEVPGQVNGSQHHRLKRTSREQPNAHERHHHHFER